MAMIFISHDLGLVAEIADQVAVMYKGKIVECGLASQIFTHPQHPYTKGLVACRPTLNQRPQKIADSLRLYDSTKISQWRADY